jgi:hypothetical protein
MVGLDEWRVISGIADGVDEFETRREDIDRISSRTM